MFLKLSHARTLSVWTEEIQAKTGEWPERKLFLTGPTREIPSGAVRLPVRLANQNAGFALFLAQSRIQPYYKWPA